MNTQAPLFAKGLALGAGLFFAAEASALQMNFDFAASGKAQHTAGETFGKGYASYAAEAPELLPQADASGLSLNLFDELMLLYKLTSAPGAGSVSIGGAALGGAAIQAGSWNAATWGAGASAYGRSFGLGSGFRSSGLAGWLPGGLTTAVLASNGAVSSVLDNLPGTVGNAPVIDITDGNQTGSDGDDVTAVPLPAAAWLMLSGLAAYGWSFRQRRTS
ncbi:hypothetical protein [Allohahella marinimesophila]|uniref:Secreted protein n=1 Tax=Allohahella marinimesophila TaxID=1054972 RepID=A0ABP7P952_9GAMM